MPTGGKIPKSGGLARAAKATEEGAAAAIKHSSALGTQIKTGFNVDK
jgi:hypothetical protein